MGQRSHRWFSTHLFLTAFLLAFVATSSFAKEKRGRVIDFEDEVVEGMNKRPLDSLASLADGTKKKKKPHLYRKRVGFRSETQETLRALRYTP